MFSLLKIKLVKLFNNIKIKRRSYDMSFGVVNKSGLGSILVFIFRFLILLFFTIIVLFPFFWMINTALKTFEEVSLNSDFFPKEAQWQNFGEAFVKGFWHAFGWSVTVSVLSVIFSLVIIIPSAYAFSKINFRAKKFIWGLFIAVLALPEVALLSGQYRLVVWISNDAKINILNQTGVIISLFLPFISSIVSLYMLRNAFDNVSDELVEAAMLDGASRTKIFFQIMLPAIRGTIWIVIILGIIASWNSYTWPALLLTGNKTVSTLPIWLFGTGYDSNDPLSIIHYNLRMAASFIAIVPLLIFYFIFRRKILSSVSRRSTGTKE